MEYVNGETQTSAQDLESTATTPLTPTTLANHSHASRPRTDSDASTVTNNDSYNYQNTDPIMPGAAAPASSPAYVLGQPIDPDELTQHLQNAAARAGLPMGAPTLVPNPTPAPSQGAPSVLGDYTDLLAATSPLQRLLVSPNITGSSPDGNVTLPPPALALAPEAAPSDVPREGVREMSNWAEPAETEFAYVLNRLAQLAHDEAVSGSEEEAREIYSRRIWELLGKGPIKVKVTMAMVQ